MTNEERIRLYEAALVKLFDTAVYSANPWTGTEREKAEHAAEMLPEQIRGLMGLRRAMRLREDPLCTDALQDLMDALHRKANTLTENEHGLALATGRVIRERRTES